MYINQLRVKLPNPSPRPVSWMFNNTCRRMPSTTESKSSYSGDGSEDGGGEDSGGGDDGGEGGGDYAHAYAYVYVYVYVYVVCAIGSHGYS
jgi:hypothetical protein